MIAILAAALISKAFVVTMNLSIPAGEWNRDIGPFRPGFAFDKVTPTWNVQGLSDLKFSLQERFDDGPWQTVSAWPPAPGTVATLPVTPPGTAGVSIRIHTNSSARTTLGLVSLAFVRTKVQSKERPDKSNWGTILELHDDIPALMKGNASREERLLSAELAFMALALGRSDLNSPPEAIHGVVGQLDSLQGLAAYVGNFLSMRAYVTYFRSLGDLEDWCTMIPIRCTLRDESRGSDLPALVYGVTKNGDFQALAQGPEELVKMTIPRKEFDRRWTATGREVLIVQPGGLGTPDDNADCDAWLNFHDHR